MMRTRRTLALAVGGALLLALPGAAWAARPKFKLAVSIYAGWMPHYFAKDTGVFKKWADRYGLDLEVVEMDYIPSIEAYVAQKGRRRGRDQHGDARHAGQGRRGHDRHPGG